MRIGIFTDTFPPEINGVATASAALAKVFRANGHEVVVVTTGQKMKKSYAVANGVVRVNSKAFKHLYNYRMAWIYNHRAARYIKSLNLDVIHVQTEIGIGLFGRLISKFYHIPLVYTYHTLYEDYTYYVTKGKGVFDRFAKRVVADLSRFCTDTSTEFTTTSEKTKTALRRYGATKYINIVPNGIDLSLFVDCEKHQLRAAEYRREHGLENKFLLLILGRLAKEKSIGVLLDHLAAYLKEHPATDSLHLLVVGDGPDRENLEEQAKNLGLDKIATFTGAVPHEDVSFYYHLADLYISASVSETQGLTFIEAMASHTMVLAKYDECLEGVIQDEVNGYFFTDQASFTARLDYLRNLSNAERETIEKRSFDVACERYSLDSYYVAMKTVYDRALRKYW